MGNNVTLNKARRKKNALRMPEPSGQDEADHF